MAKELKFSAGIWFFGAVGDRFTKQGYREDLNIEQRYELASKVEGLSGMEMHYPNEVNEETVDKVKKYSKDYKLKTVLVAPHLWSEPRWKYGAFTNPDKKIRVASIERAKKTIDITEQLNGELIVFWPAQDGYDYCFQCDYKSRLDSMVEALREVCEYTKKVKVAIEYKAFEPRTHILLGTVGQVMTIVNEVNHPMLGVNIDIGHAFLMKENVAEAVALIDRYGKLFHTHLNDNFKLADDDLIVGTVNFWETLELFFWLKELNYKGWHGLDLFPYRENPADAASESIKNIKFMYSLLDKLDREEIRKRFQDSDAIKISALLREMLSGNL